MTALPATTDWTGGAITEGGFKTAQGNLHDYLAGLLGTDGTQATALSTIGSLLAGTVTKTSSYTVVAGDVGKLIDCTTGTWSLILTAAATLGTGFVFGVKNSGAGVITIDPNGSELVDGVATIALNAGESCLLSCNGTAWISVAKPAVIATAGRLIKFTTITATNAEWAKQAATTQIIACCISAGSGGGNAGAATAGYAGLQGQQGNIAWGSLASGLTSTFVATIGAGGGSGANGGATSFKTSTPTTIASAIGAVGGRAGVWGTSMTGQDGAPLLGPGGVGTSLNGGSAAANSAAGGASGRGNGSAAGTGGSGGSGIIYVWEFA